MNVYLAISESDNERVHTIHRSHEHAAVALVDGAPRFIVEDALTSLLARNAWEGFGITLLIERHTLED